MNTARGRILTSLFLYGGPSFEPLTPDTKTLWLASYDEAGDLVWSEVPIVRLTEKCVFVSAPGHGPRNERRLNRSQLEHEPGCCGWYYSDAGKVLAQAQEVAGRQAEAWRRK